MSVKTISARTSLQSTTLAMLHTVRGWQNIVHQWQVKNLTTGSFEKIIEFVDVAARSIIAALASKHAVTQTDNGRSELYRVSRCTYVPAGGGLYQPRRICLPWNQRNIYANTTQLARQNLLNDERMTTGAASLCGNRNRFPAILAFSTFKTGSRVRANSHRKYRVVQKKIHKV